MPNYNHARFLPGALESLLAQSYQPFEIVIVDDGSTDESLEVLGRIAAQHPIIKLHRNDGNLGVVRTLQRLTGLAQGDYLFFPAADDRILPGLLERTMDMLERHPEAGLCGSLSYIIDAEGHRIGSAPNLLGATAPVAMSPTDVRRTFSPRGDDTWPICGNTTIYRRDALLAEGGFREDLHAFSDGFLLRVISLRYGACFIPEPLAESRPLDTGYAASYRANTASRDLMIRKAAELMRGPYAELFPLGYADNWVRSSQLALRRQQLRDRRAPIREACRQGRPPRGVPAVVAIAALNLEETAYRFWLHLRLRVPILPRVRARFRRRLRQA